MLCPKIKTIFKQQLEFTFLIPNPSNSTEKLKVRQILLFSMSLLINITCIMACTNNRDKAAHTVQMYKPEEIEQLNLQL